MVSSGAEGLQFMLLQWWGDGGLIRQHSDGWPITALLIIVVHV